MKRLFIIAMAVGAGLALLERPISPIFAPLFRQVAELTLFVLFFGTKVEFTANEDPGTRGDWDSNAILHGEGEFYGFLCGSGLAYQALAVFLALWVATPLAGRRKATLLRGLFLVYLFIALRLGLMLLEVLANHECLAPGSHWSLARIPWVGRILAFLNWEIAMDLVVSLLGPFLIWALVCGRDLFASVGLERVEPTPAPIPALDPNSTAYSPSIWGFDPFPTGKLDVVSEESDEQNEEDPQEAGPSRAHSDERSEEAPPPAPPHEGHD